MFVPLPRRGIVPRAHGWIRTKETSTSTEGEDLQLVIAEYQSVGRHWTTMEAIGLVIWREIHSLGKTDQCIRYKLKEFKHCSFSTFIRSG